ncbi:hypothetical protein [Mycolicibacterium vinylchloridicum]|uniref:hypothetical protein n=1 Tax=Mycolicibacterium vinylchloridicum TaxID=2736928 RepID=UPI0015C8D0B1|nr:hypothetical protein [Mycolicibacterium vinylchloridicum]
MPELEYVLDQLVDEGHDIDVEKCLADFENYVSLQDQLNGSAPWQYGQQLKPGDRARQRNQIRFWSNTDDGGTHCIEGTMSVSEVKVEQTSGSTIYTITGHMFDPITQYMMPPHVEPADDPKPSEPLIDDVVVSEVGTDNGFELLGYINTDDLEIKQDTDYVRSWGGQVLKMRQETTVEFSTFKVGPGFEKLFGW